MILNGDCLEILKTLPENSVDSVVTDPPYELGFMGKYWDATGIANSPALWHEVYRVMKPGAHLLSFGGSRTYHRMACTIEDVGFEIRDQIQWIYASGFPKSLNIGKAIDKMQGNEREVTGSQTLGYKDENHSPLKVDSGWNNNSLKNTFDLTKGNSKWEGWGTALKPAHEPIVVARKPLSEKTVAENVLKWGTGGLNIDGSRVGIENREFLSKGIKPGANNIVGSSWDGNNGMKEVQGRWPANLIHDGSEEVLECFPHTKSGVMTGKQGGFGNSDLVFGENSETPEAVSYGDNGSAARFFKECKPNHEEICRNTNANSVIEYLETSLATIGASVPTSAEDLPNEQLVQNVSLAGIRCGLCATIIAQRLVAIKTVSMELRATLDFITSLESSTPNENLVYLVEFWENTDTIPTTENLLKLFGSVLLAIDAPTKQESRRNGSDTVQATRFLYQAKASKKDRNEGLEDFDEKRESDRIKEDGVGGNNPRNRTNELKKNHHPTVKPTELMRYLIKLVTPPGGTVLDPFAGSGSTGKACKIEGFNFIGIEKELEYVTIAKARIEATKPKQLTLV